MSMFPAGGTEPRVRLRVENVDGMRFLKLPCSHGLLDTEVIPNP